MVDALDGPMDGKSALMKAVEKASHWVELRDVLWGDAKGLQLAERLVDPTASSLE